MGSGETVPEREMLRLLLALIILERLLEPEVTVLVLEIEDVRS